MSLCIAQAKDKYIYIITYKRVWSAYSREILQSTLVPATPLSPEQ